MKYLVPVLIAVALVSSANAEIINVAKRGMTNNKYQCPGHPKVKIVDDHNHDCGFNRSRALSNTSNETITVYYDREWDGNGRVHEPHAARLAPTDYIWLGCIGSLSGTPWPNTDFTIRRCGNKK